MVTGHGPGKILLFGEHAVVYGQAALGLPLSRGVTVTLSPGAGRLVVNLAPGIIAKTSAAAASPEALAAAVLGPDRSQLDVKVHFEIPPMAGFGTSAAYAVALLRAHDLWRRQSGRAPSASLYARALAVEAVAHGRPSGVDPATCLAEGLIRFERPGPRPKITPIPVGAPFYWVIGSAGAHGGAKQSISRLSSWRSEAPALVEAAMAALGATSRAGEAALRRGDREGLGRVLDLAHGILSGLGLVGPKVERTITRLRAMGALGAKMSGAGGKGGAYLALFPNLSAARRAATRIGGFVEVLTPR
jgi:mevalonate kinase